MVMKAGNLVFTYHYVIDDYDIKNNSIVYGVILDVGREWEDDYLNFPTKMFRVFWSNGKILWNRKEDFINLSSF